VSFTGNCVFQGGMEETGVMAGEAKMLVHASIIGIR
jgi:hypothetical protein